MAYVELEERCVAQFYPANWGSTQRCARKGAIAEGGELWCWQHAPTKKRERRDEAAAEQRAQRDARVRRGRREAAIQAAQGNVIDACLTAYERGTLQPELEGSVEELIRVRS